MRRVIISILVAFSLIFLVACDSDTSSTDSQNSSSAPTQNTQSEQSSSKKEKGEQLNDFDEATNLTESNFGITYQIPASWYSDNNYVTDTSAYYYPNNALLVMVSYAPDSYDNYDISDLEAEQYMSGVKSSMEAYTLNALERTTLKSDGRDAFFVDFNGTIEGINADLYAFFFKTNDGIFTFMYGESPNANTIGKNDFKKVLDTITIDSQEDESTSKTAESDDETNSQEESQPDEVTETSDQADPGQSEAPTMGEKNALSSAKDYLRFMPFSYSGLIEQLEYEGYSYEEATYAADNCGADWNEQAAKSAESYLSFMSFSREGLIEQLVYEGYTYEQAEYGVSAVGY